MLYEDSFDLTPMPKDIRDRIILSWDRRGAREDILALNVAGRELRKHGFSLTAEMMERLAGRLSGALSDNPKDMKDIRDRILDTVETLCGEVEMEGPCDRDRSSPLDAFASRIYCLVHAWRPKEPITDGEGVVHEGCSHEDWKEKYPLIEDV